MTDDLRRRASDHTSHRLTVVEVELRELGRRMDAHLVDAGKVHDQLSELIGKLDSRADSVDRRFAWITGAIGVTMIAGQVFGPAIARLLGLPS